MGTFNYKYNPFTGSFDRAISESSVTGSNVSATIAIPITAGFDLDTYTGNEEIVFLINKSASNQFISPFNDTIEPDETLAYKLKADGSYEGYLEAARLDYDHQSLNGNFDLTSYDGDARLFTASNSTGGDLTVTYGTNLTPLTIVLSEGDTVTFVDNGIVGWQTLNDVSVDVDWAISTQERVREVLDSRVGASFQNFTNTFTPKADGYYVIRHFGYNAIGTAIIRVGTTVGDDDVFTAINDRINAANSDRTYSVLLQEGVEYFFSTQVANSSFWSNLGFEIYPISQGQSNRIDSDIDLQLRDWSPVSGIEYLQSNVDGRPTVRLKGNNPGAFSYILIQTNIPKINEDRNVCVTWFADDTATHTGALRLVRSGFGSDIILDPAEGTARLNSTQGGRVTNLKNERSGNLIKTTATFVGQPTAYTSWNIFADYGLTGASSSNDNGIGFIHIESLNLNYTEEAPIVATTTNSTGVYRIDFFDDVVNIGTADTTISTGFNLEQPDLFIEFEFSDAGGTTRAWSSGRLRVDKIIERFNAGDAVDGYSLVFDNDFVVINLVDPATGEFVMREGGRDVGLSFVSLYQVLQETDALIPVSDFPVFSTTGAFRPLGDPNPLFTDEDGAVVYIEYGDTTRDRFTFFNGIARAERKGLNGNSLELAIDNLGQISIRDLEATSGISKAWYQLPIKAIGLTNGVPTSTAIPFLPSSDEELYENTVTGDSFTGIQYSNGTATYFNLKDSNGVFTAYNTLPADIQVSQSLQPSLPLQTSTDVTIDFSKDVDTFQINFRGTSGLDKNVELFLENKPYAVIDGLVLPTGVSYQSKANPDGTTNHLFSITLIGFQNPANITSSLLSVVGDNSNGSNPPTIHIEII